MALTYDQWKKQFQWLTPEQQKKHVSLIGESNNYYQQFLKESKGSAWTPNTSAITPTNSITATPTNKVTTWATWYSYNPPTTTASTDRFWDTSWATNRTKFTGTGTTWTSNYQYNPNLTLKDVQSQKWYWWQDAIDYGQKTGTSHLPWRNNAWANAFLNAGITDADTIKKTLSQFQSFSNFFEEGQNNTVQAIINRIWELQKSRDVVNTPNNAWAITTPSTLPQWNQFNNNEWSTSRGWRSNTNMDYRTEVNQQMYAQTGIDWNQFASMYPSEYQQMRSYVEQLENTWYSWTDADRESVRWQLRNILWTLAWYGSEMSQNSRYNEAYNAKFKNPDQINKDIQNVMNLQTRGLSDSAIAQQLWMDIDQVRNLILANNWDKNADLSKWYQLSDYEANKIKEPYDRKQAQLDEQKDFQLKLANIQLDRNNEDLKTNLARQKEINAHNIHNADMLAWRHWYWVSNRGVEWLQYVQDLAQQTIDDLIKNADRKNQDILNGINEIIMNYRQNSDDIAYNAQQALNSALNTYSMNMVAINQRYGILWMNAQQATAQAVQNFITEYDRLTNERYEREKENYLFTLQASNELLKLNANNLAYRQAVLEQIGSESLNMTRNQLGTLKWQLNFDASDDTLNQLQVQSVANILNGYAPGAWNYFLDEIDKQLAKWNYTGQQVINQILNSDEFKEKYWASTALDENGQPIKQYSMSNGILYNQYTWEYQDLNSGSDGLPSNIQKVKLNDGSEAFIDLATGQMVDPTAIAWLRDWTSSSVKSSDYKEVKDKDGNTYLVNPVTWDIISPEELLTNKKNNKIISNFKNGLSYSIKSFIQQYGLSGTEIKSTGTVWGQCWTFVNNYLNSLGIEWRVFWSTLDSKIKAITPGVDTPLVGAVVIMDTWATIDVDDGKWWTKKVKAWHVGIVTQVNDDWTMLVTDSNWKPGSETVSTHRVNINNNKIKWYYVPGYTELEKELASNNSTSIWDNISDEAKYYQTADVANLTKKIFWGNASDRDAQRVQEMVELWNKLWKSRQEIMYDWAWFRINWEANKNFANTLMSFMEKHTNPESWIAWTYDLASIASRINGWDYVWAIQNMESTMKSQFWDKSRTSEETAMAMVDKLNRIYKDFQKIKWLTGRLSLAEVITNYWWGSSNINNALWLSDSEVKTVASIATQIQNVYAEIRNQLAGTAVTESEGNWLKPMIPSLKDNSTVFETKIKEAVTNIMKDQNATRRYLWLPVISDIWQFTDWNERVKLYWGNGWWNTTWVSIQ